MSVNNNAIIIPLIKSIQKNNFEQFKLMFEEEYNSNLDVLRLKSDNGTTCIMLLFVRGIAVFIEYILSLNVTMLDLIEENDDGYSCISLMSDLHPCGADMCKPLKIFS